MDGIGNNFIIPANEFSLTMLQSNSNYVFCFLMEYWIISSVKCALIITAGD